MVGGRKASKHHDTNLTPPLKPRPPLLTSLAQSIRLMDLCIKIIDAPWMPQDHVGTVWVLCAFVLQLLLLFLPESVKDRAPLRDIAVSRTPGGTASGKEEHDVCVYMLCVCTTKPEERRFGKKQHAEVVGHVTFVCDGVSQARRSGFCHKLSYARLFQVLLGVEWMAAGRCLRSLGSTFVRCVRRLIDYPL